MAASHTSPVNEEVVDQPFRGRTAPTDANSIYVTGNVVFSVRLSPSFALFTVTPEDADGPFLSNVDVVLSCKANRDLFGAARAAKVWQEVERCQAADAPVTVRGWAPMEPCQCQGGRQPACDHILLHCWTVNGLPRDTDVPVLLCQEVGTPDPAVALPVPAQEKDGDPPKRKRSDPKNRARASRFAEALMDVVGLENLRSTPVGVLDVAGGSGSLTFELSLRRDIPSIVIDPRPVKFNRAQRNTLEFRRKGRELLRPGLEVSHAARGQYNRFKAWDAVQLRTLFGEEWARSDVGDRMLRECTAVVGMHPDEATDPIIELAMRYGKPWAVVPCCVFPNTFKRTLPDGRPVRKYDEFCQYIRGISKDVREIELDFEGRNKMYYWIPPA